MPSGEARKYNLNTHYFREISSREKAYILGFIYADGCVSEGGLFFGQHAQDREILEYIKECLGYSGPIFYDRPNKLGQIYYHDELRIYSKKLVEDLNKHGVMQRKSLILEEPSIEQELNGPFIRGYFDGDGSAGLYENGKYKTPIIAFSGTLNFLTWIKNNTKGGNIRPQQNIYRLRYASKKSIMPLIELMDESPFGVERKTKKIDEIINHYERHNGKGKS